MSEKSVKSRRGATVNTVARAAARTWRCGSESKAQTCAAALLSRCGATIARDARAAAPRHCQTQTASAVCTEEAKLAKKLQSNRLVTLYFAHKLHTNIL